MDTEIDNGQNSSVKFDGNGTLSPRHIQVNLSKEYFGSLLNDEDNISSATGERKEIFHEDGESSMNILSGENERIGDIELGVMPITNDESPIRGIIKSTSQPQAPSKESTHSESPRSPRRTPTLMASPKSPRSPKKVRITEPYHESQFSSAKTLIEMEGLRTQLRHMIQLTQLQNTSKEERPEKKESHSSRRAVPGGDDSLSFLHSRELFEDGRHLRGMISFTSPPSEMDENGILHGTELSQLSDIEKAAYVYTSPPTDRSLIFENSLLKESLEKEKQRRKHCEDQVQNLQKKILEMQQQLAVAVATDRKKAIMIEQLDKTLANIVAGWKKQDSEKAKLNQRLKDENQSLRKSQNKQQELLGQFEKELAHAVESLTKEQSKTRAAEQDKVDQLRRHEEQREEAYRKLQEEKDRSNRLNEELEKLVSEKNDLCEQLKDLEDNIEEERSAWREMRSELSEEMKKEKDRLHEEIERLQQSLAESQSETQDANRKAADSLTETHNMKAELDTVIREKETLKTESALLEAKIEALKAKQESETRALLEEEFNKKINIIQDEIMRTEGQLKEAHKEQMLELNQRHKEDLELQLKRFHEELNKRENHTRKMKEDFEIKLSDAQNEISELRNSRAKLESQRQELTKRLQSLMQQHIQEAVSLLNTENGSRTPNVVPSQIVQALDYQVQNTDNESVISDIQKDYHRDLNPLSSTFTEVQDYLSTTKSSLPNSRSIGLAPGSVSTAWSISRSRTDEASKRESNAASLVSVQREDSVYDVWTRPAQLLPNDEALPLRRQETQRRHLNTQLPNESILRREQDFQAGLRDLNDKLRHNDLHSSRGPERPVVDDEKRSEARQHVEEEHLKANQWDEIQQLLKSKLDEVTDYGIHLKEDEAIAQEQLSQTRREDVEENAKFDEEIAESDEKNKALASLIEKLLQRSPGNPSDNENEYEDELLEQHTGPSMPSRGFLTQDPRGSSKARQLEYLPVGSDSVTRDSIEGNLKTPPRVPRTGSSAPAFKRSILRERPIRPSYGQFVSEGDRNMASPARVSPQKESDSPSEGMEDARKQLVRLMRALEVQDDRSKENRLASIIPAEESNQSHEKRRPRGTIQQNGKKPQRSSGSGMASKPQPHPKPKQRMQDDIFTRLHKIYGNPDKQALTLHAYDHQSKAHVPKQVHTSRASSSHSSKQTRLKDQKKAHPTVKPPSAAWK